MSAGAIPVPSSPPTTTAGPGGVSGYTHLDAGLLVPSSVSFRSQSLDWFRAKVRQALDLYAAHNPQSARAFAEQVKRRRDEFPDDRCCSEEGDEYVDGLIPKPVRMLLALPEDYTLRRFGKPCGTGSACWETSARYKQAFFDEMQVSRVSSYRGVPAHIKQRERL